MTEREQEALCLENCFLSNPLGAFKGSNSLTFPWLRAANAYPETQKAIRQIHGERSLSTLLNTAPQDTACGLGKCSHCSPSIQPIPLAAFGGEGAGGAGPLL